MFMLSSAQSFLEACLGAPDIYEMVTPRLWYAVTWMQMRSVDIWSLWRGKRVCIWQYCIRQRRTS